MQSKRLNAEAKKLERDAKNLSKRIYYVILVYSCEAQEISRGNQEGAHIFCDVDSKCVFHVASSTNETPAAKIDIHGMQAGGCCL